LTDQWSAPNAEGVRLVRDGLRHLHDFVAMQKHPLTELLTEPPASAAATGTDLRQILVEAVAAAEPPPSSPDTRARQRHRLLVLRYLDGLPINDVASRLSISRREYNREHREALEALVRILEDGAALRLPPGRSAPRPPSIDRSANDRAPLPLTSFVGRERELAEIGELLKTARCVTLLGPPGAGKTRLALEVHRQVASGSQEWRRLIPDGTAYVSLAPLRDHQLVGPAIAQALGLHEVPTRPVRQLLVDYLSHRGVLLTLDNFEQVTAGAPLIAELLSACPQLRVLVTSREALRISGEHHYAVAPLTVPPSGRNASVEEAASTEAVQLYVQRARAVHRDFHLTGENAGAIAEICRRLDGLPLAVELAAARVRLFPPEAFVGRLSHALTLLVGGARDVPVRQQTLRSAIEWSFGLLSPKEKRVFAGLSVFPGSWTIEAAESACTADGAAALFETLSALVDKSLVRQEVGGAAPRFTMLETIREYAREQLERIPADGALARQRHAEYYLGLTVEAESHMLGPVHGEWLLRLNAEFDNIRAAFAWFRDTDAVEAALRMAGGLGWFWFDGSHWTEGQEWLESALALAPATLPSEARATALAVAGVVRRSLNDFFAARALLEQSLDIWRELGDARGTGRVLIELSVVANAQGEAAAAGALAEEGLVLARSAGDKPYVGLALYGQGVLALAVGDQETARRLIEESRVAWRESGSTGLISLASNSLGDIERANGRYAAAASLYEMSLATVTPATTRMLRAVYRHNLGHVKTRQGDDAGARMLFCEALADFRDLGDRRGVAECVAGLAAVVVRNKPALAAELFGTATTVIAGLGSQVNPSNRADYDHLIAAARETLGDEGLCTALARGHGMTLEDAVTVALSGSE
jgi:predicted ATPase